MQLRDLDAPVITELTRGFFNIQAMDSCASVQPNSLAMACNLSTTAFFLGSIKSSRKNA